MYEYVQTAKGWVLCWGGAGLYRAKAERPQAAEASVRRTAESPRQARERKPADRAA